MPDPPTDAAGPATRRHDRATRLVTATLTLLVMVGCAAFLTLKFNRFRNASAMSVVRVLDGESTRPYSARVLVPMLSNGIAAALPGPIERALVDASRAAVPELIEHDKIPDRLIPAWTVLLLLHLLAYLGLMGCLWRMLTELYEAPRVVATAGAVLATLGVQLLWIHGARQFYDPPTLFFGGLLTLAVARGHPWWFLGALAVASLNKETAAVYVVIWALCSWNRTPRRALARTIGIQIAVVVVLRLLVIWIAGLDGPSERQDNFIRDYWDFNRYHLAHTKLWIKYPDVTALIVLGILLFRKWSTHPAVIRASWAGVAILFLGLLRGGVWGEVRIFSDVFAPLAVALVVNVIALARGDSGPATLRDVPNPRRPAIEWAVYLGLAILVWALAAGALAPRVTRP